MEFKMLPTEVMEFVSVAMDDSERMEDTRVWIVDTSNAV